MHGAIQTSRGTVPVSSWCLEGSLNPFHHDLRSRLFGGEAGVAPGGGWLDWPAWLAVGTADAMLSVGRRGSSKDGTQYGTHDCGQLVDNPAQGTCHESTRRQVGAATELDAEAIPGVAAGAMTAGQSIRHGRAVANGRGVPSQRRKDSESRGRVQRN